MPYSKTTWSYLDPLTIQKLTQGEENAVWIHEHGIYGCTMDITGTSTVKISDGRIALNGEWLVESSSALTTLVASTTAHWEENTALERSATAWYVVAKSSGAGFNVLFRNSGPAYSDTNSGTATGMKLYDKTGTTWYRYIATVWNDSGNSLSWSRSSLLG